MENDLNCNFSKCRKPLDKIGWVTSCSHIFCEEDGSREFTKSFKCPACGNNLLGKFDIIRADLQPSEQYKSMILAGCSPDICLDIMSRAMAFWTYQIHLEIKYQSYTNSKAKEKSLTIEQNYERIIGKAQTELTSLKNQVTSVKNELENTKKKLNEVTDRLMDKSRQYQKLQSMYEGMRRRCVTPVLEPADLCSPHFPIRKNNPFIMETRDEVVQRNHGGGDMIFNNKTIPQSERRFEFHPFLPVTAQDRLDFGTPNGHKRVWKTTPSKSGNKN